jgi:hypothetical protein
MTFDENNFYTLVQVELCREMSKSDLASLLKRATSLSPGLRKRAQFWSALFKG